MERKIEGIIFDMDGVLLDTESLCLETWILAGNESGWTDEKISRIYAECLGTNKNDTKRILAENLGGKNEAEFFMDRTSQFFAELERRKGIKKMFFAAEALELLKKKGYRLSLASSTRKEAVERQMKNAGLFDFFETVTTGDQVEHSKPHPEIYRIACTSLSLPPEKCAAVEDSPNGILSAKNAGLFTVMIPDKIQPSEEILKNTDILCSSLKEAEEKF